MTNRGTAYIMYDHPSGSESAIAHMHEAQLDGSMITVSIVLPRRAFSRSPPPARGGRGPPPGRNGPLRGPPPGRFRSPPRRGGFGGSRRDQEYPQRSRYSRSPSPPRRRRSSPAYSRSPARSPPRRRGAPARSPPRRRRRSPSYSSYSSYSRSRSRTRSPSRSRYGGRR
jgi:RNA-binding protein with serine-rich domain 1